jgi:hypothetical protein
LTDLHRAIQAAYCWDDFHLFQFVTPAGTIMGDSRAAQTPLCEVVGIPLQYNYDFGDDWWMLVTVRRIAGNVKLKYPRLTSGAGLAPPEDIGGTWSFAEYKKGMHGTKEFDAARMDVASTRFGFKSLGGSVAPAVRSGKATKRRRRQPLRVRAFW